MSTIARSRDRPSEGERAGAYINLAAAHAFKGEMDEAKAAMAEARRLKPDLSVKWLMKHKPVLQFPFEGLRKAGLPEE
jgi:hypothetical protein